MFLRNFHIRLTEHTASQPGSP